MSDPIVVVGASLAANRFVRAVRRAGWDGGLVVVGDEPHPAYDRPPLSKQFLAGDLDAAGVTLRTRAEDVEHVLGVRARRLVPSERRVELADGRSLTAADVVVATGAHPRRLPDTDGLGGVHVLRTLDDAAALRDALARPARLVVIGAGFIGCEVASTARRLGHDVTVVDVLPAPLVRGVGPQVGRIVAELHREHSVHLRLGVGVEALTRAGDHVTGLRLVDGTDLPADVVLVAIGAVPTTEWLDGSGLEVDDGVVCDDHLRARGGGGHVWAMGDVCRWAGARGTTRLEHWTNAVDQAGVVAHNLLGTGRARPYDPVPFVWSDQHGLRLQVLGRPDAADRVEPLVGDLRERRGVAGYVRDDVLTGVVGLDAPRATMAFRHLLERGATLDQARREARDLAH